jgi:small subunit ribosomal protein S3Ae
MVGWTPANKTMGTKLSKDHLMNRVCEVSYSDIKENTQFPWKKIKMQVEEVKSGNCYSSFYGVDMVREKLYYFLRKKMSLIDCFCDVKTMDGYILRCLVTTFTARKSGQVKSNTYAKSSQIRAIRKIFTKILTKQAQTSNISEYTANVLNNTLAEKLQTKGSQIFPLGHVLIRKVKVLKKSKIDVNKLVKDANQKRETGGEGKAAKKNVDQPAEADEAKNLYA